VRMVMCGLFLFCFLGERACPPWQCTLARASGSQLAEVEP